MVAYNGTSEYFGGATHHGELMGSKSACNALCQGQGQSFVLQFLHYLRGFSFHPAAFSTPVTKTIPWPGARGMFCGLIRKHRALCNS
jgi:hypothetical protein